MFYCHVSLGQVSATYFPTNYVGPSLEKSAPIVSILTCGDFVRRHPNDDTGSGNYLLNRSITERRQGKLLFVHTCVSENTNRIINTAPYFSDPDGFVVCVGRLS